jgi:uncharacterized protein (TIGR00369 family)
MPRLVMFTPADTDYAARIRSSFARQTVMTTLGAALGRIAAGEVEIALHSRPDLVQQHGFLHAGILATVLDSACGYAAYSLMPADAAVLSVEFKINLLAPALGERFVARARVVRPGRTITVCLADALAVHEGREKPIATMLGTMMCVRGNPSLAG